MRMDTVVYVNLLASPQTNVPSIVSAVSNPSNTTTTITSVPTPSSTTPVTSNGVVTVNTNGIVIAADSQTPSSTTTSTITPTAIRGEDGIVHLVSANMSAVVSQAVTNPATIPPVASSTVAVAVNSLTNNAMVVGQPPTALQHHQNVRDMDIVHVQWLLENYETAEGVSLPRSTLYTHYQNHCTLQGIEPVNAASFGKLIRSVFIGLRTRRLGTRGNSKYHYYGIRVKPGSSIALMDNGSNAPEPPQVTAQPPPKRAKVASSNVQVKQQQVQAPPANIPENHQATLTATSHDAIQSHLGEPNQILTSVWPEEPTVPTDQDTDNPGVLAIKFAACYRKHYEEIINCLGNLQFNQVEHIWQSFWQPKDPSLKTKDEKKSSDSRMQLTIDQLHALTTTTPVPEDNAVSSLADWIIQTDYTLYNALISLLLLPNLLKPIPQQLTQQIRNFAKNISGWMTNALNGYDANFVASKVGAVSAFSHTLRRYTSLNHLSSAARAVLQNQQQVSQMIQDLNRVDFKNVQEQASWVCQCDDDIVEQIEMSFKDLLQQENPFDRWSSWCEQILDSCLPDNEVKSATQFNFKWGFYSSLVMRDLTLRSASSFGSFHLIRLLFDEYIFYLIEHRVAKATSKTPLQVLGESRSMRFQNNISGGEAENGPN